jgi:hypothetical protein
MRLARELHDTHYDELDERCDGIPSPPAAPGDCADRVRADTA